MRRIRQRGERVRILGHTYGRWAVTGLALAAIPVIIAIVYLFVPKNYGGKSCGSLVIPKYQPTTGVANPAKLLDNKVRNAGCSDVRAYNLEIVILCGGGGLLAGGLILSMAHKERPVGWTS